jgi:predicted small secreted protein
MKKTVKSFAAVMLVLSIVFLFASCGNTLKGTYKSTGTLGGSLTFDKDNKVTGEIFGVTVDGTYEIKDNQITFSYTLIGGLGGTLTKSFEKDGNSIFIDGTEFVKQK